MRVVGKFVKTDDDVVVWYTGKIGGKHSKSKFRKKYLG